MRLSRVHYPVTALGPGRRLGIWLQGCSIGCKECVSRDTWDPVGGCEVAVADLLALGLGAVDGVTISGGEPFDQPDALAALLDGLRDALPEADLLCFSGYPLARLQREHAAIIARLDALVPEPYVAARPHGGGLRGSDNQPLLLLTERALQRFAAWDEAAARMQVVTENGRVWMIGVPRRGDLERLTAAARAAGVSLEESSWQS